MTLSSPADESVIALHSCGRSLCGRRLWFSGGGDQFAIVVVVAAAVQQEEDAAGRLVVGVEVDEEVVVVVVVLFVDHAVEKTAAGEAAAMPKVSRAAGQL